ncbi:MAG: sugar ABC transporter substrate-binding protein [Chloroflexi bacterium]|nr:sugar ABC transporter substrate-binding protein [Chloroflexota bacterium]
MTTKKLSRRQFLMLTGSGMTAAALAACAQPTPAPAPAAPAKAEPTKAPAAAPAAKTPITVDFLAWGDNTDLPAWEKLHKLYMEKNPHVTIKVTSIADPGNNFYPKLQTMIAGGAPPHLASFQGWEWQTYADKNLLAPIDDYIARDKFTGPYAEGIAGLDVSTRRKGKRYLIPLQMATMIMFYAKKPFKEAGIPFPTDDWTWEQFLDTAKKLTKTDGANKLFGYQANGSWFRDIGWIVSTGKREFDNIVDPKKAQFSAPEIVEIVQIVANDVYNTLKIAPTPADQSGGANTIQTGNCAMKYEGAWFFTQLNSPTLREQKKEVEFDVVLMPKGKDGNRPHRGWSEGVAVPKTKPETQDAAWAFASFMGGEEGDKIYSETTGRIPNDPKLVESFWIPKIKELYGVGNGKAFLEAFKKGQIDVVSAAPRSKMWSEVVKPIGWDPLIAGKAKASEVLPKVDAELQKMLDEANKG